MDSTFAVYTNSSTSTNSVGLQISVEAEFSDRASTSPEDKSIVHVMGLYKIEYKA